MTSDAKGDAERDTARRLVDLESRVLEQDRLLEQLNEVVIEQGAALERLAERVRILQEAQAGNAGESGAAEPPPPHY